jgi:hypothetical protein
MTDQSPEKQIAGFLAKYTPVPFVCILLALACKRDSDNGPFDYSARVFVADEDSSGLFLCFATEAALAPGMAVTVVFTGMPQHFTAGRLATRKRLPCIPPSQTPPIDSMQFARVLKDFTLPRGRAPLSSHRVYGTGTITWAMT